MFNVQMGLRGDENVQCSVFNVQLASGMGRFEKRPYYLLMRFLMRLLQVAALQFRAFVQCSMFIGPAGWDALKSVRTVCSMAAATGSSPTISG